jgi:hypothetical protein
VSPSCVGLLDARQEQDLVVHRQAEDDAEHQDRDDGDGEARRREAQHAREVAVLEDPDERTEAGGQRQQRHHDRLDRQNADPNWSSSISAMATRMKTIAAGQLRVLSVQEVDEEASAADGDTQPGPAFRPGSTGRAPARPVVPASGLTTWR